MKISYNWLRQFIETNKSPQELSLILTNVGLEVESLEIVQPIPGGLQGLKVGRVLSCEQHPNADRLKVTTVDVGAADTLQIVCGAPNVAKNQMVIVATVGSTIYPTDGEPFKINKSKIRGEVSEGMICAEDEIGLGVAHDGIMVLPPETEVGILASTHFNIKDDYVFEIGLTPNRADAASHLGVARDLAAYFRKKLVMPEISAFSIDCEKPGVEIKIENIDACPRYSGVSISGVKVSSSPEWLQDQLKVIGLRPINNVVDATNFVLHELGQPLHAFDADRIKGGKVFVKFCAEGTPFTTLDGVERKLSAEDLMICDEEGPMCIAGVFGGKDTGVNELTTEVFLESAYFNAVSVRKTSKRHGLKTDASFRFERGTDPEITLFALKRAALLIQQVAGGTISSSVSDLYPRLIQPFDVQVSYERVNRLIGAQIPSSTIKEIITALDIEVTCETSEKLDLKVPSYRVDVTRECDITEEVLRIYGYDQVSIPAKINASLSYASKPNKEQTQHTISDMLTANGYLEIWCNSLTKGSYSKQPDEAVNILNPLSSDLNIMRQSLLLPALESVAYNQKRKISDIKFYEFGKTYHFVSGEYVERGRLLILISGLTGAEQWNQKPETSSFYHLKAAVDAVVDRLGISDYQEMETEDKNFLYGLKYMKGSRAIVSFGAATSSDKKLTGVEKDVYYADFDWDLILDLVKKNKIVNSEVAKYPVVRRDLSMLVDLNVSFSQLSSIAFKTDRKLIKDVQVFDVYQGENLPKGKKSYALSFLLQDEEQTLTDKKIDAVMQKIIANLVRSAEAEIRK